ncbi:MAG: metal-dependent hydrolase [Methanobacteriota archaeon]
MQPIIHFTMSLLVGAMLARGQRHPLFFALACGILGMLPDLDHFLTSPSMPESWLHSGYFLVVAPTMLFAAAFVFDHAKPERNANAQTLALAVLAVLAGHMALDIAAGNALPMAYPVETGTFVAARGAVIYAGSRPFLAISDVPLALWAAFCVMAFAFVAWDASDAPDVEDSGEPRQSVLDNLFLSLSRPWRV